MWPDTAHWFDPAEAYLATERVTAAPTRLREVLYDGVMDLCRQALAAQDAGRGELAGDRLARARRIVAQLAATLAPDARDERAEAFAELYQRAHRRLIEAGFYHRRRPVAETFSALAGSRGDWLTLVRSAAPRAQAMQAGHWVG